MGTGCFFLTPRESSRGLRARARRALRGRRGLRAYEAGGGAEASSASLLVAVRRDVADEPGVAVAAHVRVRSSTGRSHAEQRDQKAPRVADSGGNQRERHRSRPCFNATASGICGHLQGQTRPTPPRARSASRAAGKASDLGRRERPALRRAAPAGGSLPELRQRRERRRRNPSDARGGRPRLTPSLASRSRPRAAMRAGCARARPRRDRSPLRCRAHGAAPPAARRARAARDSRTIRAPSETVV